MEREARRWEVRFGGRTIPATVTDNSRIVDEWAKQQRGKLFGMDVKWNYDNSTNNWNCFKSTHNRKAALLSLCGENGCLIVQLLYLNSPLSTSVNIAADSTSHMNYVQPSSLHSLLENSVIKVAGVGIQHKADKLSQDYQLQCRGLIDLQSFASKKFNKRKLKCASLDKLAIRILDLYDDIEKPKNATLFSWTERELYPFQVECAAIDAFLSYAVAKTLLET